MLVKSIIAGTVLSLMAGGVVYFGTDMDTKVVKDKVVQKTANTKADISKKVIASNKKTPSATAETPSVKTATGKIIEAKKPTMSYSSSSKKKDIKTAEVSAPDAPQKKWLDQYLKTETPENPSEKVVEETVETEIETDVEEKTEIAKDLMESMGLTKKGSRDSDTASFIVEEEGEELTEEEILQAEAEGFEERARKTENIWTEKDDSPETADKTATRKMLHDIIKKDRAVFIGEGEEIEGSGGEAKVEVKVIANENGETTIETETIDMGDGKIMKIVKKTVTSETKEHDGKNMHIKVLTDDDRHMDGKDIKVITLMNEAKSKDISSTVNVVMEQAKKIKMPELRDRAYLDLVSYGLSNDDYDVAEKALKNIEHVEMRDKARNHIAVAYAKDGNAGKAFGTLDNIEVEALRDVMRLQVIEAMIAPDALPEDMQ